MITLHRLKNAVGGPLFKLADGSKVRRNPDADLNRAAVADALGISRGEVAALVRQGHLAADADGYVTTKELDRFVAKKLEPVDYLEAGEATAPPAQVRPEPATSDGATAAPDRPAGGSSEAPVQPPRRSSTVRPVEADDDDDGEPEYAVVIPCPSCKTSLGIGEGVERFKCPRCGKRLELVSENPDVEDEPEEEPRGFFLGIRALGQRRR